MMNCERIHHSSFIIHHSSLPSRPLDQPTLILGPGKRPGPKHLPVCGYESQSAIQLSGGGENGVDGRTTARQGSCFGPSPDEPAFQPRQLRPPRESDAFEVVFGWPPVLKGKLWPRTEVINPRCFGDSCQPQTQVSSWWPPCCSGGSILPWKGRPTALRDRAGCERRHSLVSFGGRNRKAEPCSTGRLTRRCSRRLAGLFPRFPVIKIVPETGNRALASRG